MKKILIFSFILITVFCFAEMPKSRKPYKIEHSDNVTIINGDEGYISKLEGNVHFFYSDVEYNCDSAMIYEGREFAYMLGNVHAKDDTMNVVADSIAFDNSKNMLYMAGDIEIREYADDVLSREFYSETGSFNRNSNYLKVKGDVRMFSYVDSVSATCGYAEYNHSTGYGFLRENPILKLVKKDSLTIESKKVEFFHNYQKYIASFDVIVRQKAFTALSSFLIFFSEEERALFTGDPVFISDFAKGRAEEFTLFFQDNKLKKGILRNQCNIDYATSEGEPQSNWVKSDLMDIYFVDDNINHFKAYENVSYFYDQKEDKTKRNDPMQIQSDGRELNIFFKEDDEVEFFEMNGKIKGKYRFYQ